MKRWSAFVRGIRRTWASFWRRLSDVCSGWRDKRKDTPLRPLATVHTGEVPEAPADGKIYVVGEAMHQWYVVLACPCGCGETVHLSLLEDDRPRWQLTQHENATVTLFPSVWRSVGCRSHFFVRRGKIQWCQQDDQ